MGMGHRNEKLVQSFVAKKKICFCFRYKRPLCSCSSRKKISRSWMPTDFSLKSRQPAAQESSPPFIPKLYEAERDRNGKVEQGIKASLLRLSHCLSHWNAEKDCQHVGWDLDCGRAMNARVGNFIPITFTIPATWKLQLNIQCFCKLFVYKYICMFVLLRFAQSFASHP
jgi:hypothetical protein